jgi:hypothetical protein
MRRRGAAALGDGWHVGIVTVAPEETSAVLDVLGIGGARRFHTGRMAVPGGVTYLVAAPPAGSGGVAAALGGLCDRYDPAVVVHVAEVVHGGDATGGVVITGGREPVVGAMVAFFAAAGEPATLPGYGGDAPFRVAREPADEDGDVPRFCANTTTRRGKPLAWATIRGDTARDAAQTLRYLIPYLRPRMP